MSKFLLRRKYFQRHSQLLNSIATEIVFVLKIWKWYFGKQENASKTFWLTFHLFLVLLQNQLWKNIPVTLLQLFQLPNPSALKHLCLLSFEYKACKLQVAILFYSISPKEVSKSFSLSQIFRQWLSQREDIYISFQFSKMSRQHWSTQLQDAGVPDFFFPCLQDLFLVLVGHFVYLFCDVLSQDCLIFVTAGALVVLRI